jgi:hypothetical protein
LFELLLRPTEFKSSPTEFKSSPTLKLIHIFHLNNAVRLRIDNRVDDVVDTA